MHIYHVEFKDKILLHMQFWSALTVYFFRKLILNKKIIIISINMAVLLPGNAADYMKY